MPNYSTLEGQDETNFMLGSTPTMGAIDSHRDSRVRECFDWVIDKFRDAPLRSSLITLGFIVLGATAYNQVFANAATDSNPVSKDDLYSHINKDDVLKYSSNSESTTSKSKEKNPGLLLTDKNNLNLADIFDFSKPDDEKASSSDTPKDSFKKDGKVSYSSLTQQEIEDLFDDFLDQYAFSQKDIADKDREGLFEAFKGNIMYLDIWNAQGSASYGLNKFGVHTLRDLDNLRGYYGYEDDKFISKVTKYVGEDASEKFEDYYYDYFDMFFEELEGFVKMKDDMCGACGRFNEMEEVTKENIVETFDWRKLGAVTEVRDQGLCGAGYAFAVADNVASAWYLARHSHKLKNLSPQYLASCDYYTYGCMGGWFAASFPFIHEMGIHSDEYYPFESQGGRAGWCKGEKLDVQAPAAVISSWTWFEVDTPEDLQLMLLRNGPLVVGISGLNLEFYESGIDNGANCDETSDHAMLLVGWGKNAEGRKYWILKNSWGTDWGIEGYWYADMESKPCGIMKNVMGAFA